MNGKDGVVIELLTKGKDKIRFHKLVRVIHKKTNSEIHVKELCKSNSINCKA